MASVTIDFGSSTSGACINFADGSYKTDEIMFVHSHDGYPKQPTCFWIKKDLLNKRYDSIKDADFRILSLELNGTTDPNIIWTKQFIANKINEISKNEEWVCFERFKMNLYNNTNDVKGSDDNIYDLSKIIKIFLRIIKIEVLHRIRFENFSYSEDEIKWAVTIPAIWDIREQIPKMHDIINDVFPNEPMLLFEPESAFLGIYLFGRDKYEFCDGRTTLTVDLGGGTTDIICLKEVNYNGEKKIRHITEVGGRAAGGNDIDFNFWSMLTTLLRDRTHTNFNNPIDVLWVDFKRDDPRGALEMEENWGKIKHNIYYDNDQIHFQIPHEYMQWIRSKEEFAPIASYIDDCWGQIPVPKKEIEKCITNVADEIKDTVSSHINHIKNISNIKIDQVILAGGLSLQEHVKIRLQSLINDSKIVEIISSITPARAAGAILYGAAYIIANPNLIQNQARSTLLTNVSTKQGKDPIEDMVESLMWKYSSLGLPLSEDEIRQGINKYKHLIEKGKDGSISYLSPLFLKGQQAYVPYNSNFIPHEPGQTKIKFDFYTTTERFIPFPSESLTELKKEPFSLDADFGSPFEEVTITVDFNDQANSAKITLKKNVRNISSAELKNIIRKGL